MIGHDHLPAWACGGPPGGRAARRVGRRPAGAGRSPGDGGGDGRGARRTHAGAVRRGGRLDPGRRAGDHLHARREHRLLHQADADDEHAAAAGDLRDPPGRRPLQRTAGGSFLGQVERFRPGDLARWGKDVLRVGPAGAGTRSQGRGAPGRRPVGHGARGDGDGVERTAQSRLSRRQPGCRAECQRGRRRHPVLQLQPGGRQGQLRSLPLTPGRGPLHGAREPGRVEQRRLRGPTLRRSRSELHRLHRDRTRRRPARQRCAVSTRRSVHQRAQRIRSVERAAQSR